MLAQEERKKNITNKCTEEDIKILSDRSNLEKFRFGKRGKAGL